MATLYSLVNSAEKLVADARKTAKQSRRLIESTHEQIELSHRVLSEAFKKPYILKGYIDNNKR